MGNPAGKRRDFSALEQRRLRAARLLRQGVWQAEVARRVGVHRQSVGRWAEQLKEGGERALKKAPWAGRPPRLHPEDLRRLERRLKQGPASPGESARFKDRKAKGLGGWTARRVAELIWQECKVRYDPSQAWRILRQLGWRFKDGAGWARGNG